MSGPSCGVCHRPVRGGNRRAALVVVFRRPWEPIRRARICPRCLGALTVGWRR
jgi:hypothetical protein